MNPNDELGLHTDLNYWYTDPMYAQFQCGICLEDCLEDCGGFYCLPRAHKAEVITQYKLDCESGKFGEFRIPAERNVFQNYLDIERVKRDKITVPLEKGDVVIWNNNLPHNGGSNCNPELWRLQAYVRFLALEGPSLHEKEMALNNIYPSVVRECMESGKKPRVYATGNKTNCKKERIETVNVELTSLGEKVLGVKSWDE